MPHLTGETLSSIALFPEENPYPVLRISKDGILLYANRAAKDLLTQWHCDVNGTVPEFVRKKIVMTLKSGLNQELEVRCGERVFSFAMVAIENRGYVNFYGRDVTKRMRAEENLARNKERLKRTQEIAHLGSWELDLAENRLMWSDEAYRIFGFQPNEFQASYEDFLEAVHPDDRDAVNEAYSGSIRENRDGYEIEHRVVQKRSGKILYVHEKCEHVKDETGNIVGSVGMTLDITSHKQKQMEIERLNVELEARASELEKLNKDLEAFNYMLAHDLRAPLTVINGYCEVLESRLGGKLDEESIDCLKNIMSSAFNMNQLIDALLNFSNLAHAELNLEKVNLSYIANQVMSGLSFSEPDRRFTFHAEKNIVAHVDKILFSAVMKNLLGNAWKYTADQEEAVIEFGMNGGNVFFVRDNGRGFSMDEAHGIFKPFQRLRGSKETSGFGIGLATVERIIQHHGGTIWAEGSSGKGATFYFSL